MRARRERGITVLEGVIALSIVATIAASMVAVTPGHFAFIRRSHQRTVAGRAAAAQLERLRLDPSGLASGSASGSADVTLGAVVLAELPGVRAERTVETDEHGLYRVRIRVAWDRPGGGSEESVSLETLIAAEAAR